jgi:hypothetical protein
VPSEASLSGLFAALQHEEYVLGIGTCQLPMLHCIKPVLEPEF